MLLAQRKFNNDTEPAPDTIVQQNVLRSKVKLLDTFTGSNNTSIASHTPDVVPAGSSWAQSNASSFYIQSNTIQPNRQTNGDLATIDSKVSNIDLTCIVTPYSTTGNRAYPGLVFRYVDTSNFWYIFPDSDNQYFQLFQVNSGTSTEMMRIQYTLVSGTPYTLRIVCKGNNITIYVNGIQVGTIISSFNATATIVGMRYGKSGSPASVCSWDSFSLTQQGEIAYNWPVFTEQGSSPDVAKGIGGSWESSDINDPTVVFDSANSRYVMLYSGYNGSGNQQLGIAYATSLDGPWTKEPTNPVFVGGAGGNPGQNGGAIMLNGTCYYYWGDDSHLTIDLATSTNFTTWVQTASNVLSSGGVGTWDSNGVFDAFARLSQDGKTIQLWYVGQDVNGKRAIGLATSTDGINFTKSPLNPIINFPAFANNGNNFGEPSVFVPVGMEGKQIMISFDATSVASGQRFIVQAISTDGMQTWHFRLDGLKVTASFPSWESVQVFDSHIITDANGNLYLFHSGANTSGGSLGLNTQLGHATASPVSSLLK